MARRFNFTNVLMLITLVLIGASSNKCLANDGSPFVLDCDGTSKMIDPVLGESRINEAVRIEFGSDGTAIVYLISFDGNSVIKHSPKKYSVTALSKTLIEIKIILDPVEPAYIDWISIDAISGEFHEYTSYQLIMGNEDFHFDGACKKIDVVPKFFNR
jgi:hypothetical protein